MVRRLGLGEKQPSNLCQSCSQPSIFNLTILGQLYLVNDSNSVFFVKTPLTLFVGSFQDIEYVTDILKTY